MSPLPPELVRELRRAVLRHYRKHRRDLPWRNHRDPYAVWVSEIMLQQTRVATVIPYFERWMSRFPTVDSLASAPQDDVLSHWSGLGYYSRARNLQKGAKELVANYGSQLPESAKVLRSLPGIGPYTAGAISSIAFAQREALVDGNVLRVVSRLFEVDDPIKSSVAQKRVWALCEELVPPQAPGDFNQGLMELGATICKPKTPLCDECPLAALCIAKRVGRTSELPVVAKRKRADEKPLIKRHALFLQQNDAVLLGKRNSEGLFAGLWEFPQAESRKELQPLTGLELRFRSTRAAYTHQQELSHRRLEIRVWPAVARGELSSSASEDYVALGMQPLAEIDLLGVSSATMAILCRAPKLD